MCEKAASERRPKPAESESDLIQGGFLALGGEGEAVLLYPFLTCRRKMSCNLGQGYKYKEEFPSCVFYKLFIIFLTEITH